MNRSTLYKFLSILCCITLMMACKKENDRAQWDVDVIGPILHASLGINNFFADSTIQTSADGQVRLILEQSLDELKPDSIYTIPDTSLNNVVVWPIFPTSIAAGTPFYSNNNIIALGVTGVQLTRAIIKNGSISIDLKNTLPVKVIYTYTIPKAKKGGIAFSIVQAVDAAGSSGPGTFTGTFSLAGYEIDLTGVSGTQFNTIAYDVTAVSDPSGNAFTINTNDVVIDIRSTISELEPEYVKGYLGQNSIASSGSGNTGLSNHIQSGMILLDSAILDIRIDNCIGADAQAVFHSLHSINDRNGTAVSLNAPSLLNRTLNINRARESGPAVSPVLPSSHFYHLDNSNSNIRAFAENLPDRISHEIDIALNPLGNISFYNDFLYSDQLVKGKISLTLPLRFAASDLAMADTQDISLSALTDLDPLGPMNLTLLAKNGFPFDFDVQLYIMDENYHVTDSLLIPGLIRRGNTDSNYKVISQTETRIEIPVDSQRKDHILQSKYMGIRTVLNSPDYPQYIPVYADYKLDLQLIANGTYYIR